MTDRGRELQTPEPLKGLHLAAGAWRSMQRVGRPMLVLGGVIAVGTLAAEQAALSLGISLTATPANFLALAMVTSLISLTASGLAVRMILQPEAPRWRIDGRLLGYVVVVMLMALVANLLMGLYLSFVPLGPDGAVAEAPVLTPSQASQMLGVLIAMGVVSWLTIRLVLWPVGILVGDRDMRPSRSYGLMRRGVVGVILAYLVLCAGPFFIFMVLDGQARPWGQIIAAPFAAFVALAVAAVQAETYRQRTRERR